MKMITIWTILFLMCLCVTVQAQWSGFPLASNTNRFEWENIRTNWIQLLLATDERSRACGEGAFSVSASYVVPAGITNIIGGYEAKGFTDSTINHPFLYVTNSIIDGSYIGDYYYNAYNWIMSSNILSGSYIIIKGTDTFADYYYNSDSSFTSTNWFLDQMGTVTTQHNASTWFTNKYTNVCQLVKSIVMTNLNRTPYTYTDETGTHNATGFPYVTQAQQHSLDTKIINLIPFFVDTNKAVSGKYDDWFSSGTNDFPKLTKSIVFTNTGVGIATNGESYFTRAPMQTNRWLLYEAVFGSTGNWITNRIGANALRYYETIPPVLQYTTTTNAGTTNPISSYSFVISGDVLVTSNQAIVADTETVAVTSSNTQCTKLWYDITGITCATDGANTGDWVSVSYTNAHPVYGDAPYEIYALDFDERYKILNALTWSRTVPGWNNYPKYPPTPNGNYYAGFSEAPTGSWTEAKRQVEAGEVNWFNPNGRITAGRNTYGAKDVNGSTQYYWTAYAIWESNSTTYATTITNVFPSIAIYQKAIPLAWTNNTFDLQGDSYTTNGFSEYTTFDLSTTNKIFWLGATNVSTTFNWPAEPASNSAASKGYDLATPLMLLKWNANTNGFRYQ